MLNIVLWITQVGLAALFLASGTAKSTMSRQRLLATGQTGVAAFPMPVVRFAAVMEVLAALGLVLPWATGIAPVLTPRAGRRRRRPSPEGHRGLVSGDGVPARRRCLLR